ncbi:enhancer of polycomb-like-domain-containing protein [Limtongia smithiae]|uniref:enhancer of polycomb-like-domain-containing protein n=1 Tax=Limtongia smithiae TaxID=1125753 RepID=UPI0034CFD894
MSSAPPSAAAGGAARFRQRKISVKQALQVLRQVDFPDIDEEQQREIAQVETGVEKGEEEEHHLQAAINASLAAVGGAKVAQIYIPTPDASRVFDGYSKYYTRKFVEPQTYIRFSSTVEDTCGCPYCLDERDYEFLEKMNTTRRSTSQKCSEDMFEQIMHTFEIAIQERQAYLQTDVSKLLPFEDLESAFAEFSFPIYLTFARLMYPHWRARKIERNGKPIMCALRFEDSAAQAPGAADRDDADPYICFRRREFRQVRKTRRSDAQSSDKLRRLREELDAARFLTEFVVHREAMRKEALQLEWDTFKQRNMLKDLKRKLGIRTDDDDLLSRKRKAAPSAAQQAAAQAATAQAAALAASHTENSQTGSRLAYQRAPEMDLITLDDVYRKREAAIDAVIEDKITRRRDADVGWTDFTDVVTGWLGVFDYVM